MFSSLIVLVLSPAFAADPPCYGHTWTNRVEGEHVWVEWDDDTIDQTLAETTLATMEAAWTIYADDLGFRMPAPQMVVSVFKPIVPGASGRCTTDTCDGVAYPRIELYYPSAFEGTRNFSTGPHELGHAVQYAYMGEYVDSVQSWLWWMEGSATWFEMYGSTHAGSWSRSMEDYLEKPHLALHHGAAGLLSSETSGHMYGTALLAHYLDTEWGGPGAVKATWEYGETVSGTAIWFPDALADQGIEFSSFWPQYLSVMPTLDVAEGEFIDAVPPRIDEVGSLPANGAGDEEFGPQGLGFNVIRFAPETGAAGMALSVSVDTRPDVVWHAVLARTDGSEPGADVLEWVALEEDPERVGRLTGSLSGFDGSKPAFLVVSPEIATDEVQDYSWTAELIKDPAIAACACSSGARGGPALGLLVGLLAVVRRRRATA